MKIKRLHNWDVTYEQARRLQIALAGRVLFTPMKTRPKTVAGLDCALSKDRKSICAAVVLLRLADFEVIETHSASEMLRFPYIPGLLSFREAPVCIAAAEKLLHNPDVFIVDGQGTAHPRRLGLACHLGLFFDRPTIGCAKSRLAGTFSEPGGEKGSRSELKDNDQIIGSVVRTRKDVKPVFVSVGHRCTTDEAVELVLACSAGYRLPEPSRLAHRLAGKIKLQL